MTHGFTHAYVKETPYETDRFVLVAVVAVAGVVAYMAPASGHADGEAAPIFVTKFPPDTATGG